MKTQIEPLTPPRPLDVPPLSPDPATNPPAMPLPMVWVEEKRRWAYKCILRNLAQTQALTEDELNTLGAEGWELAAAVTDARLAYFYFKRPVR